MKRDSLFHTGKIDGWMTTHDHFFIRCPNCDYFIDVGEIEHEDGYADPIWGIGETTIQCLRGDWTLGCFDCRCGYQDSEVEIEGWCTAPEALRSEYAMQWSEGLDHLAQMTSLNPRRLARWMRGQKEMSEGELVEIGRCVIPLMERGEG